PRGGARPARAHERAGTDRGLDRCRCAPVPRRQGDPRDRMTPARQMLASGPGAGQTVTSAHREGAMNRLRITWEDDFVVFHIGGFFDGETARYVRDTLDDLPHDA